jgi:hypothetical protein
MARPGEEGKLYASGTSHSRNAKVAEIYNQVLMMLSDEIFDPESGKRVLIDQAFIVAGGEITKQALNRARQRTRRLAATADHLHGPQRHPGPVRIQSPVPVTEGELQRFPHRAVRRFRSPGGSGLPGVR